MKVKLKVGLFECWYIGHLQCIDHYCFRISVNIQECLGLSISRYYPYSSFRGLLPPTLIFSVAP